MLVLLSFSGHYPNKLIELTETEVAEVDRIQGEAYLFDTPEGEAKIRELKAKPGIEIYEIVVYA